MRPHNGLFLLGFFYYLILPPALGLIGFLHDMPGMDDWLNDYNFAEDKITNYYTTSLLYLISFYAGSLIIKPIPRGKNSTPKAQPTIYRGQSLLGIALLILTCILLFENKESLFSGYQEYNTSLLGSIATISSVSLFFSIFSTTHLSKIIFFVVTAICSVILLGLGSRMYVLIPMVALAIYRIKYSPSPWPLTRMISVGGACLLILTLVGSWRVEGDTTPKFLIYIILAEPIFTWWSTATFLANNSSSLFETPINYIQSFANILPAFIFPQKSELITNTRDMYNYTAPLGADSVYVSITGNFGIAGGAIFLAILGSYYSAMERLGEKHRFAATYYIMISSVLPFQFFRDNFSIINKQIFWNFLLMPAIAILLISSSHRLLCICSQKRKAPPFIATPPYK